MTSHLEKSTALWNRSRLELDSDEVLAQILDRGEIEIRGSDPLGSDPKGSDPDS